MRIEIVDDVGMCHRIDSQNLRLVGEWFAEEARLIMSADTRVNHPARVDIWPSTHDEAKLIPEYHRPRQLTQDDVLELAKCFTEVSAELGEREARQ